MKVVEMAEETCCECGTSFQVESQIQTLRKNDGKMFFCPNGHPQFYTKSYVSRLKELETKLAEVNKELEAKRIECTQLKCALLKYQTTNPATTGKGFFKRLLRK